MIDKQAALELIQALPDGVTTEDILAELYFKHQVDQGIADLQSGRVLTHEEMKDRVRKWRASAGR